MPPTAQDATPFLAMLDNSILFYQDRDNQNRVVGFTGYDNNPLYDVKFYVFQQSQDGTVTNRWPATTGGDRGDGWEYLLSGTSKTWTFPAAIDPDQWGYMIGTIPRGT